MAEYAFGVDIGGTTVKLGLFTAKGEVINKWEIPTRKDDGGKYILEDIAKAIEEEIKDKKLQRDQIIGIGMGVPGPVKDNGVVNKCVNLGWGIFNVEEELSKMTGLKVKAGNDANMAALGEMWQGGGKGHKSVVFVTLGTGVGGGIIINGKIVSGAHGAGGEIGHIHLVDDETETCGCGKKGCLEQYASATGIVRLAKIALNNTDKPSRLREVQYVSAKEIFDSAKLGDELARELVENNGESLGKALAQIACVVDPEVFVIGGGVSKAGDILLEPVRRYYEKYAFHACREAKFELATLGNDAGMFGGAKLILG